jgi:DNA-binding NtrC family response regulator
MTAKKSILVVDDEQICRDLILETLKPYDYEINAATNGEEALESFKRSQYDLLITDLNMTGISGLGLLKRIWSTHPWIKVIIITGDNRMAFYLESMVIHGLLEYQLKPINKDELRKTVSEILSQQIDSVIEETADQRHVEL